MRVPLSSSTSCIRYSFREDRPVIRMPSLNPWLEVRYHVYRLGYNMSWMVLCAQLYTSSMVDCLPISWNEIGNDRYICNVVRGERWADFESSLCMNGEEQYVDSSFPFLSSSPSPSLPFSSPLLKSGWTEGKRNGWHFRDAFASEKEGAGRARLIMKEPLMSRLGPKAENFRMKVEISPEKHENLK